jgi:HPt (histidine-containing phosphotransfer) domain-containing protein
VAGGEPPPDALHQLHEVLHGVAGSAGTFGFAVFGREARRIEQMVRRAGPRPAGRRWCRKWRNCWPGPAAMPKASDYD